MGQTMDAGEVYNTYADVWPRVRHVLKNKMTIAEAMKVTRLSRRATIDIREGRSQSSKSGRAEITARAIQWLRDRSPNSDALSDLEVLLAFTDDIGVIERSRPSPGL